jgi:hypothetical protein
MAVSGDTVLSLVFPRSGVLRVSCCFRPLSVLDTEEPGDRVIVVSISVVEEAFCWLRSVLLKWDTIEEDVWPLVPRVFRCLVWRLRLVFLRWRMTIE